MADAREKPLQAERFPLQGAGETEVPHKDGEEPPPGASAKPPNLLTLNPQPQAMGWKSGLLFGAKGALGSPDGTGSTNEQHSLFPNTQVRLCDKYFDKLSNK